MESPVTGLERIVLDHDLRARAIGARHIGLITNFTSVTRDYHRAVDALIASGIRVVALFSPEHGMNGTAQAGHGERSTTDPRTGLPIIDLYALSRDLMDEAVAETHADMLVFDLQDVGTRFWTYSSTMIDALRAAGRLGLPFVVLDRPNPLGREAVEGPLLDERYESFVGRVPIPIRHGLTLGQMARLTVSHDARDGLRTADLRVIHAFCPPSGFMGEPTAWLPPSPNLATIGTARVYPGMGLLEGTNCSEGRGTTHPFEMFGAPWADDRLAAYLTSLALPGALFRAVSFMPSFSKHAGDVCHGAYLHVVDPTAFRPVRTGLAVLSGLRELYPKDFSILPSSSPGGRHTIDLLWGSDRLRRVIAAGDDVTPLAVEETRIPAEIYPPDIFTAD
ncbi:MAG: DUF1343 domain-containing protein [Bifidobacterium sp.]|jgi:uncharacterized protein YbbC (DUF1343 family)|nr:DUF1343 domain-containing protein [Bifidobacterium sp.]MCI1864963.1 DUF1343 domain-containing protein [Bifidobacterium sp.]